MLDEMDYFRKDEITCPYCGWEDKDSWEITESGEVFCGECGKEFYVERIVYVKYTSKPL